ncbi:MAG: alkaline phosphatase family protein [Bacteroidota bacterium]|nr:alkaline phosphatase family protein [Bacteroidota bacterium]
MSKFSLQVFISLSLLYLFAIPATAQNFAKPRLIVTIMVDPLSPQWIEQVKDQMGSGGINKLLLQGTVFSNAHTGQILSNRSSSVASMSTGTTSSVHGIVGMTWYDRLRKEEVFSTEDYQIRSMTEYGYRAKHSAHQLLVTSFGDQLKTYSEGKVISICLEPDGAILGGGHRTDGTYWFDSYSGRWMSNAKFIPSIPQWVIDFNNNNQPDQYMTQEWDLLSGSTQYPNAVPDNSPFEIGLFGDKTIFPYKLKRLQRNSSEGEYEILRHTPFGNTMTTDFTIAALYNEKLGQDESTDYLNITFTAFEKIISLYGYESQEAVDALLRLDLEIQHLLYILEENVGRENILVIFSSTHGISWNVDLAASRDLPAGRFRARNSIALLNSYLSAIYGENYWIESYLDQQIYLDQTLIDQNRIPIEDIQEKAARFMIQFHGVSDAFTASQLSSAKVINPEGSIYLNAFHSNRSGDILVILKPGWIEDGDFVCDHLSPYPNNQSIPLIIWGGSVSSKIVKETVQLTDIAPSLSEWAGIPQPDACSGISFLKLIFED